MFSREPRRRHFAEYLTGLMIAHDDLFANYARASGKHDPLEFRRFKKREQGAATGETFESRTVLFCQLIDWDQRRDAAPGKILVTN